MRIASERIVALILNVGVWAAVLVGGRHMLHLLPGEARALAHLAAGRGRFV